MHSNWLKNPLGNDIGPNWCGVTEINESKIIGNSQKILWILRILERLTKEARVFTVMINRTAHNLLSIVKKRLLQLVWN